MHNTKNSAKPFLKWAGGKKQLLNKIEDQIPVDFKQQKFTYIEPFIGGGAVFFHFKKNIPTLKKAVINDVNADLINAWKIIQQDENQLIEVLKKWEIEFLNYDYEHTKRKKIYYQKRKLFNSRTQDKVTQAALLIFLNRTCFNGLFRMNSKNEFNVPIGKYKNPQICNTENLHAVHQLLQEVEIISTDFSETLNYAEKNSFFYLDPPYRPLNKTSSFVAYSKSCFSDKEQIRLKKFCDHLHQNGHKWLLSNSDTQDHFFDKLYTDYTISRVQARRSINSKGNKRGAIKELLITNYPQNNERD